MPVINHDRKFIYLFEPHTASRAMRNALVKHVPGSEALEPHHQALKHIPGDHPDYKIIVTARNPFDTHVTKWHHHQFDAKRTFQKFVDDYWTHTLLGGPGIGLWRSAGYFCRYESLQADVNAMFGTDVPLEYVGRTRKKKTWRNYYTQELHRRFAEREDWMEYLERFGYMGHPNVLYDHL